MTDHVANEFGFHRSEVSATERFDLLIATCGYETRSTHVAKELSGRVDRIVAFQYEEHQTISFESNASYFNGVGETELPQSAQHLEMRIAVLVTEVLNAISEPASIAIDISSFNRERIAAVVRALHSHPFDRPVDVTFFYAVGTYDSHLDGSESRILVNGPIAGFEGWSEDPARPVAAVVGLGFENLMALAALETLEPARTIAFLAESADERFQSRVLNDNQSLIKSSEVMQVAYSIEDAFTSLHQLEGVVFALKRQFRVAIVPLGPKLFALIALLVASQYPDEVAVWRVSADAGVAPQDRLALGPITELRTRVIPRSALDGDLPDS